MGTGNLGQWADTILTGLFVVAGAIMIFFILLQEGKGGGLAALGGTKAAGVEGVTNPIRRATVYVAILFFVLAMILGALHKPKSSMGVGTASTATAPSAGDTKAAAPDAPKKAEETKPAETKSSDTKPAETKSGEAKPAEGAKTDAAKPAEKAAEGVKVEEKAAEIPKTEEKKPADAPKADDTKKDVPAK